MSAREVARRSAAEAPAWLDRVARRGALLPPWATVLTLTALLTGAWAATYVSGGTHQPYAHLFYIPIVAAVLPFGTRGALATALVAGLLCGPLMPLDTATGTEQATTGWLFRMGMFLAVGGVVGLSRRLRESVTEQRLTDEVQDAMELAATPTEVDEAVVPLVADVLEHRRFHPVFQPIYSLADGRLIAVEALTRFDVEPYRTPDVWFRAAARAGLGVDLEIAAIVAVVDAAGDLPPGVAISINASPVTLSDPRLAEQVLRRAGHPVIVEITEHAVVADYHLLKGMVADLRALGVRIAVDDAGAGFATLRHIVQLAPETIKLDISLTQGVATSPLRRALAGAIIDFAQRTGAELVVEGIEETSDLTSWAALGADAAQGYLLGRPGALPVAAHSAVIAAALRSART